MRLKVALVIALVVAAHAVPVAAQDKISIGYLVASSAAPIKVIQQQNLAQKHGLELEAREFLDVAALDRALVLGEYDVHSSLAVNTFGEYLTKGNDLVMVLGTLYPHTAIVVPKNSAIKTIADLKGKRLGVYGLNASSTALFGVIVKERLGWDVRRDIQLFGSAPPTLPTLLGKGEVDAILVQPPFVPRMVASGDYRILLTTNEEWAAITGNKLPFAAMIVTRKVMEAKRPALKKLAAAWKDAVEYIRKNPDALNAYLATAKITEPAAIKVSHEIMLPHLMNSFTDKDVENIRIYWDRAVKTGFMTKPVESQNWYTLEFAK